MSSEFPATTFPRRDFLKAGGALLVGLTFAPRVDAQQPPGGAIAGPFTPDPEQLDTWIAIHADNTATMTSSFNIRLAAWTSIPLIGEDVIADASAAIANAFFDATGVRLREHPMTPSRVVAALRRG
jgi:hypothetical protein